MVMWCLVIREISNWVRCFGCKDYYPLCIWSSDRGMIIDDDSDNWVTIT